MIKTVHYKTTMNLHTNRLSETLHKCGFCILILLHGFINVLGYFSVYLSYIINNFKELYKRTNAIKSIPVTSLKENINSFPKIPIHLVVIVEEEDISYKDCIKLILWCLHSGIPFISFYSCDNAVNPTTLYEVLCKRSRNSLQRIKWGKSFHKSVKEMAKKDINGYIWMPEIEVNLFSLKSVQECIEGVMLNMCKGLDSSEIEISTVDQQMKDQVTLPDPCFAIIYGKAFSTFGFMPWQIRVTEFLHIPTHHNLQIEDFVSALKSYAYCEQRFGK